MQVSSISGSDSDSDSDDEARGLAAARRQAGPRVCFLGPGASICVYSFVITRFNNMTLKLYLY